MQQWAVVNANNVVENIVEWDGDPATWQPPEGSSAVALDEDLTASVGDLYVNGHFEAPPPPNTGSTWSQRLLGRLVANGALTAADADEIGDGP